MNRTVLEKPFAPGQIRQRKGRNGVLDYVEGHSVIARLNEAFDGAWSFEVAWHEVRDDEVVVLGKLTAEGIQFGASAVTRDRKTRAALSLGDDLKAAATDALKKCPTFFGVGLHLYAEKPIRPEASRPAWAGLIPGPAPAPADGLSTNGGPPTPPADPPTSAPAAPVEPPVPSPAHASDRTAARTAAPRVGAATPRQLETIWRIAAAKGLDAGAVDAMSLRAFNRKPAALTTGEASALIRELSTMRRVA